MSETTVNPEVINEFNSPANMPLSRAGGLSQKPPLSSEELKEMRENIMPQRDGQHMPHRDEQQSPSPSGQQPPSPPSNIKGPKIANTKEDNATNAFNGIAAGGDLNLATNSDEMNVTDKSRVKIDRFRGGPPQIAGAAPTPEQLAQQAQQMTRGGLGE